MFTIKRPVQHEINQHFGEHPDYYAQFGFAGHEGVDFLTPPGYWVKAAADGVVIRAAENTGPYGTQVRIQSVLDGYTVEHVYAHLSKLGVKNGQNVKTGQPIGLSGNTGTTSTGPHLHFTLKVKGFITAGYPAGIVDPEPFFEKEEPKP